MECVCLRVRCEVLCVTDAMLFALVALVALGVRSHTELTAEVNQFRAQS